jgi:hypothetical protein
MNKMVKPIGKLRAFYTTRVTGVKSAWTAKFIFVASNAWSPVQAAWLDNQLSQPTTFTFVVMNSPLDDTRAPCLSGTGPNNASSIISRHPYTLIIAGHNHTYAYYARQKEVIVGNGGAPLSGAANYGFVIARQQANGSLLFTAYDYQTNAATSTFTVH